VGEMDVPLRVVTDDDPSRGGPASFDEFVESTNVRLFRALYLMTGSRQEAEEVMQDAFLAVWERWDRVRAMDDPTGYLFRTALNVWRKRLRRATLAARKAVSLAPKEDPFDSVDEREVVFDALRTLRPKERAAIVVTGLLGYSAEDAGPLLGMTGATVRMYTSRARAALKDVMEDPR
jgi:RNA polymerase sigma factor (sigma-70 family)